MTRELKFLVSETTEQLFRVPCDGKDLNVRFVLPLGCPAIYNGEFYTNYTPNSKSFLRDKFTPFKFEKDESGCGYVTLNLKSPGSYDFYVKYEENNMEKKTPYSTFQVFPNLSINGKYLPIEGILMQTVIPKWLGPIKGWLNHFRVASESGFNMIHFAPLQKRGDSDSPYSISDQLSFSDEFFVMENGQVTDAVKNAHVQKIVHQMERDLEMLSVVDIVWNHTSNETEWLRQHPESGYNLVNCPYLKPAFDLDSAIIEFSRDIVKWCGFRVIENNEDLDKLLHVFEHQFLPTHSLIEFFILDALKCCEIFKKDLLTGIGETITPHPLFQSSREEKIEYLRENSLYYPPGKENDRLALQIKTEDILSLFFQKIDRNSEKQIESAAHEFTSIVAKINEKPKRQFEEDLKVIIKNLRGTIVYERLDPKGPQKKEIFESSPLASTYFARLYGPENEDPRKFYLANNGWIWGGDPLVDFAGPQSRVYFLRELIPWSDSVKLRYGNGRDDNPWLWDQMVNYTKLMARIFHGLRIDNCHSTPIHVGRYMLDAARQERNNSFIFAELFAGSPEKDRVFVKELGLHCLVREAMAAHDPKELSHILHRNGGSPIGSTTSRIEVVANVNWSNHIYEITEHLPLALFADCTHDNQSPSEKRTAVDALSTSCLVSMVCGAVASTKGYDELLPRHIPLHLTNNTYQQAKESDGIIQVRKIMSKVHVTMAQEGYTEIYVHRDGLVISVTRSNPKTGESYILAAHTAFSSQQPNPPNAPPIRIYSSLYEIEMLARLEVQEDSSRNYFQGLKSTLRISKTLENCFKPTTDKDQRGVYTQLQFLDFPPGSVILIKTRMEEKAQDSWNSLLSYLDPTLNPGWFFDMCFRNCKEAKESMNLTQVEFNILLYKSDSEERDSIGGFNGTYVVPNYGSLQFCGLQGFVSLLKQIQKNEDMGHPFFGNIRDGNWAMDYITDRLNKYAPNYPGLKEPSRWLTKMFTFAKNLPFFLQPRAFTMIVITAYEAATQASINNMSEFAMNSGPFVKKLALGSVQLYGCIKSASLQPSKNVSCLAAGLPHFATQYMRCWGRDTFIALRGLFLTTQRTDVAKQHLLAFGSCLRHGLMPNLLDSGRNPRYNCRDAVWWYLQAVQDYCKFSYEGLNFLDTTMERRFPTDDFVPSETVPASVFTVKDLILEVMERHAKGIEFKERNAGKSLDHNMTDQGFNIKIYVDWDKTGFVFGGNEANCGTWMDKMGESEKAGNKGIPATPRDGADIEIIGLLKSTLNWIVKNEIGVGVKINGNQFKTFVEWNKMVESSFERCFYIPKDPNEDHLFEIRKEHVNRRGIYKDTYLSRKGWTDYQLRPNFCVAMVVAPEMFDPTHAQSALEKAEQLILGPLGMKTLDPGDWNYRGYYDNQNDSNDFSVAKGFNYHQGPEWVWCTGYFFRAYIMFKSKKAKDEEVLNKVRKWIRNHENHLMNSSWMALPELTNQDGSFCRDGCPSQAWSFATLLDTLHDIKTLDSVVKS